MKKIIGVGAAGNKMAIRILEDLGLERKNFTLINTTMDDIPVEYLDIAIKVGNGMGGAGKEPERAERLMIDSIVNKEVDLRAIYNTGEQYDGVLLLTSTEGGTGVGIVPLMAEFYREKMNINVSIIGAKGFGLDARGHKNYMEFLKKMKDTYDIQIICNEKFLDRNNNFLKAQEDCNLAIVNKVAIKLGLGIIAGDNNIDAFDLYKATNTPGYQIIEKKILKGINNRNDYDNAMADMLDSSKALPTDDLKVPRMGIIYNIVSEKLKDCIDYRNTVIREKMGEPGELFTHIQNVGDCDYICVICSGMNLSVSSFKETYEEYMSKMNKIQNEKDKFFDEIKFYDTNTGGFDMTVQEQNEDASGDMDFFKNR